jgi:radical SAM enzyme (TIGR01210 family)
VDLALHSHSRREARHAVDPSRPYAFLVEHERAESGEIVTVATIFLTNRECPWRCVYCDLWKNTTTETVPTGAIPTQIDYALSKLADLNIRQIKLYNAGSFFDPNAIPPEDFPAIAERLRGFERVIVECHPALVGESAVRFRDLLTTTTKLEVAMGLEIADDVILARLNKRMTLVMFKKAADFLRARDMALRVFIMVKPPFVRNEDEALDFARRSIDFAFGSDATAVSLIPTRFGPAELQALAQHGDFAPPKLATLEAALDYGVDLRRGRVFADLWDLGQFADCQECFPARRARLETINLQQQPVPQVVCRFCRTDGQ